MAQNDSILPPKPEKLEVKLQREGSSTWTLHRYVETRPAWFRERGRDVFPIWQFVFACQVTGARRVYGYTGRTAVGPESQRLRPAPAVGVN